MIQTAIEQAVAEFVARSYVADGVASGDIQQRGSTLTFLGALAGQPDLAIRSGEIMDEATLPAVQVVAQGGEEDDLGNQTFDVEVSLLWPAHGDGITADQLARLDAESARVQSYLFDDDLGELMQATNILNTAASVIGVPSRSSRREFAENVAVHTLTLNLYTCDLAGIY